MRFIVKGSSIVICKGLFIKGKVLCSSKVMQGEFFSQREGRKEDHMSHS